MEKNKRIMYTELCFILGNILLAFGSAFMERGNLGMSMVVAPAYILHLKISEFLPFFSFGMASYVYEFFLLVMTGIIIKKFKTTFLFSFANSILYGFILDGACALLALVPEIGLGLRVVFFAIGMLLCSAGVAFMFQTYFVPGAHEVFVMEVSKKFNHNITKFKTFYDIGCLVLGVILSFAFYGIFQFNGIGIGTVINAFLNGLLIGLFSKLYAKIWRYEDGLKLRTFFSKY